MDIWSMGLVLVTLLLGRASTRLPGNSGDPPITCIENCLLQGMKNKDWWVQYRPDIGVTLLRQDVLDKDLKTLRQASLKSLKGVKAIQMARIWDELIFKMLKVKPEERLSAKTTLQTFNAIIGARSLAI